MNSKLFLHLARRVVGFLILIVSLFFAIGNWDRVVVNVNTLSELSPSHDNFYSFLSLIFLECYIVFCFLVFSYWGAKLAKSTTSMNASYSYWKKKIVFISTFFAIKAFIFTYAAQHDQMEDFIFYSFIVSVITLFLFLIIGFLTLYLARAWNKYNFKLSSITLQDLSKAVFNVQKLIKTKLSFSKMSIHGIIASTFFILAALILVYVSTFYYLKYSYPTSVSYMERNVSSLPDAYQKAIMMAEDAGFTKKLIIEKLSERSKSNFDYHNKNLLIIESTIFIVWLLTAFGLITLKLGQIRDLS